MHAPPRVDRDHRLGDNPKVRIALFVPCFVDLLQPEVGMATARLLERLGHDIVYDAEQTCCGQPALNAGHIGHAKTLAERLLRIFEAQEPDAVVAPSGSCVAALRVAGPEHLGIESPVLDRLYELTEFLTEHLGIDDVGAQFEGRVTWHDACHPLRELGIGVGPRRLLRAVRGLDLRDTEPSDECCGFGGMFAVKAADVSAAMGTRKIEAIERSGADWVASTESSCLMQIEGLLRRRASPVRAIHIAEILGGTA